MDTTHTSTPPHRGLHGLSADGPTARLRQATMPLHRALEAAPAAQALMADVLPLPRYRQVLERWLAAWQPLEEALQGSPWRQPMALLLPAPRVELGRADLAALVQRSGAAESKEGWRGSGDPHRDSRAPVSRDGTRAVSEAPCLPDGPAALVGWCYALRGAALGGAVIARHLQRQPWAAGGQASLRFWLEADLGRPGWPAWRQLADRQLADPADLDPAIDAARLAMGWMLQALQPPLAPAACATPVEAALAEQP